MCLFACLSQRVFVLLLLMALFIYFLFLASCGCLGICLVVQASLDLTEICLPLPQEGLD